MNRRIERTTDVLEAVDLSLRKKVLPLTEIAGDAVSIEMVEEEVPVPVNDASYDAMAIGAIFERKPSEVMGNPEMAKLAKVVSEKRDFSNAQILRILRVLGLESTEIPENLKIRLCERGDIPQVANIYKEVAVNPNDLEFFGQNGGIFQPLGVDGLKKNYDSSNYVMHVMEHEGKVIAYFDFILPPDSIGSDTDYIGTVFDPQYFDKLKSSTQDFVDENKGNIIWLHDLIVKPGSQAAAGYLFTKEILRKLYDDGRGTPYGMCEIWNASYSGDPTSQSINLPSSIVFENVFGAHNIDNVPLERTFGDTDLSVDRRLYVLDFQEMAEKGKI